MNQTNGIALDRKGIWAVAKLVGVDADAIVAKHFLEQGNVSDLEHRLYPASGPSLKALLKPAPKVASKAASKKPAAKGQHVARPKLSAEARMHAAAMKKRWAKKKTAPSPLAAAAKKEATA